MLRLGNGDRVGKGKRGSLGLNCWQDWLPATEMGTSENVVPASLHLCVIVLQTKSVVF